jgi:hypothetical protein
MAERTSWKSDAWVACISAALLMAGCTDHAARPAGPPENLDARRDLLCSVQKGMSEDEVLKVLGRPDEVRTTGDVGIDVEAYRWVYGIRDKGEFSRVGSVIFTSDKKVFMAYCPARSLNPADAHIAPPFSETAQVTPSGMYCSIDKLLRDVDHPDDDRIMVSLVNTGKAEFAYPNDYLGIRFSIIVEVYDARKNLLIMEALQDFHSPYSFDRSKWPVLRVAPGGREWEVIPLSRHHPRSGVTYFSWRDENDGALTPGTYYVRVAFPFGESKYYGSNLVKWNVQPPLRQPETQRWTRDDNGQWIEDKGK